MECRILQFYRTFAPLVDSTWYYPNALCTLKQSHLSTGIIHLHNVHAYQSCVFAGFVVWVSLLRIIKSKVLLTVRCEFRRLDS